MQSFRSPKGPVIPCLHMIPLHVLTKENVYHLRLWIGQCLIINNGARPLVVVQPGPDDMDAALGLQAISILSVCSSPRSQSASPGYKTTHDWRRTHKPKGKQREYKGQVARGKSRLIQISQTWLDTHWLAKSWGEGCKSGDMNTRAGELNRVQVWIN